MKDFKICRECNERKTIDEFYANSGMKDGHLNKCKECVKKNVRENYYKNHEYYQEYEKSRRDDPERLKARREHSRYLRKNEPDRYKLYQDKYCHEKRAATNMVNNAIRDGRLQKQPCAICGDKKVEAHHYDYSKPLDVIWLCKKHHSMIHRKDDSIVQEIA
jgi:hypothetical protein